MSSNNNYNQYYQQPVTTVPEQPQTQPQPWGTLPQTSTMGPAPVHQTSTMTQPMNYGQPAHTPVPAQPATGNMTLPHMIMPTTEQFAESARKAEMDTAGRPNRFKFPPPPGVNSWDRAALGASHSVRIWLCPGYEAGRPLDHLQYIHFVKTTSYPRGIVVRCDDSSTCLLCQAHEANKSTVSKPVYDSKVAFCRRTRDRLYNILTLDDEAAMQTKDGVMRPVVANFSNNQVHGGITEGLTRLGANALHPQYGRPWVLSRTKTGVASMNVMTVIEPMDPQPLPQHLWPLLSPNNLWKLHATTSTADQAKQAQLLRELELTVDGSPFQRQQVNLPFANQTQQQTYGQVQQVSTQLQPQHYAQAQPQPAPQQQQPWQQPQQTAAPASNAWTHPPTSQQLDQMPAWDAPKPQPYAQPQAQAPASPPQLRAPLAGDVHLPDDRQRCFGQHDAGSNFCASCPPWIKNQCVPQTPQRQPAAQATQPVSRGMTQAPSDAELQKLEAQLLAMSGPK